MRIKDTKLRTKVAVGATLAAAVITGGGVALAFFTGATGNSTGTGAVGTHGTWTVTGPVLTGNMYPGQGSDSVASATIRNTSGNGNAGLQAITVQITAASAGCTLSDFSLSQTGGNWVVSTTTNTNDTATFTPVSPVDIAPGHYYVSGTGDSSSTGNALPSGLSVSMADNGNQTTCAGGNVTLQVSAS